MGPVAHLLDMAVILAVGTGIWYLGAAASITFEIRSWIAAKSLFIHELLTCPACSGTWYGFGLAAAADLVDRPVLGLTIPAAVPVTGLVCMVGVPLLAARLLKDLSTVSEYLGEGSPSTADEPTEAAHEP